jgi:alpha-glucuronidase
MITLLVSRYRETIDIDTINNGEEFPSETLMDREPCDVKEVVIDHLKQMNAISRQPIRSAEDCRKTWAYSYESIDPKTCSSVVESVHIRHADGRELSAHQLHRLYRAAKLI